MGFTMEQTRKRMKFEILLERYFSNFPRIMLTNLIFFVPLIVLGSAYFFLQKALGDFSTLLLIPVITLLFPFFAGVVLVCRNIARGDEGVKVFSTFLKGVRENFLKFMFYGFLLSFMTVLSYYSISVYSQLLSSSWMFYAALFVCILIALEVLFIACYVPVMTVTFDLSLKHIFKNSFLMSFGEIKNNFFALVSLAVVLAICFTITAFFTNALLIFIITLVILALILPASCQFVISFFVYDDMYGSIAYRDTKAKNIDDAITDAKNKKQQESAVAVEDYSDVDISTLKDTDDYIFYKGKMIKQSVLLRRVLEQRGELDESSEKKDV